MPIINATSQNLERLGPLIEVELGLPSALMFAMKSADEDIPPAVKLTALIDSGASVSCFAEGRLDDLGLSPIGLVNILTPSSGKSEKPVACHRFAVRLYLPDDAVDLVVVEVPMHGQGIDMLIGRDILARSIFIYNGSDNSWSLSF